MPHSGRVANQIKISFSCEQTCFEYTVVKRLIKYEIAKKQNQLNVI